MPLEKYPRTYVREEMNAGLTADDIVCPAGDARKVAYIKCPAQTLLKMGAGHITNGGADIREFVKIKFVDSTGTTVPGIYQFAYANAAFRRSRIILEKRSEDLEAGATVKLGETAKLQVKQDSHIVVYFVADAAVTIDMSHVDNSVMFPVTQFEQA